MGAHDQQVDVVSFRVVAELAGHRVASQDLDGGRGGVLVHHVTRDLLETLFCCVPGLILQALHRLLDLGSRDHGRVVQLTQNVNEVRRRAELPAEIEATLERGE